MTARGSFRGGKKEGVWRYYIGRQPTLVISCHLGRPNGRILHWSGTQGVDESNDTYFLAMQGALIDHDGVLDRVGAWWTNFDGHSPRTFWCTYDEIDRERCTPRDRAFDESFAGFIPDALQGFDD